MSTALETPLDVERRFAEIVDQLTRRGLLTGIGGAGVLAGLAACGNDGPNASSGSTRKVTTSNGTFTVPTHPDQVVCIDYFTGIFLVELGLAPAGGIDYSWVDAGSMYAPYVSRLNFPPSLGNALYAIRLTAENLRQATWNPQDLPGREGLEELLRAI